MIYGLDVHKEFIQVCALGAKGSKRQEYRIAGTEEAIADWARPLGPRDQERTQARQADKQDRPERQVRFFILAWLVYGNSHSGSDMAFRPPCC